MHTYNYPCIYTYAHALAYVQITKYDLLCRAQLVSSNVGSCCVAGEGLSGIGTAPSKLSGLNTAAAAVNTQVRSRVSWGITRENN